MLDDMLKTPRKVSRYYEGHYKPLVQDLVSHYEQHQDLPHIQQKLQDKFDLNPTIHFDRILSGSSVIDSLKKLEDIKSRYPGN